MTTQELKALRAKWAPGNVLYRPQGDELYEVIYLSCKARRGSVLAILNSADGWVVMKVTSPGKRGIELWELIGNVKS